MKLHKNLMLFNELIHKCSKYYNVNSIFIEKDYFVVLILKNLIEMNENIVFKGCTSLSKCYKLINRFSEDIDITLNGKFFSQSHKRQLKKQIIEICDKQSLKINNLDEIQSRKSFNCYKIEYSDNNTLNFLSNTILLETSFILKSFPTQKKNVSSIISDYLMSNNQLDIIDKYELFPFEIETQSLERTLIDKVYILCDSYLSNKKRRLSRHIYDIHMLLKVVDINEDFIHLIQLVKNERKSSKMCYSLLDNYSINELLLNIVNSNYFKKDYNELTTLMLYEKIEYNEVIKSIKKIIELDIF